MNPIRKSNGLLINLEDGIIDKTFSVGLIGSDVKDYAGSVANTLIQKLDNYANDLPPEDNTFIGENITPLTGQLWYDTSDEGVLRVYDESNSPSDKWKLVSTPKSNFNVLPPEDNEGTVGTQTLKWYDTYVTHLNVDTKRITESIPENTAALSVDGDVVLSNSNSATGNISGIYSDGSTNYIGTEDNPLSALYTNRLAFYDSNNDFMSELTASMSGESAIIPSNEGFYDENSELGSKNTSFSAWHTKQIFADILFGDDSDGNSNINISEDSNVLPYDSCNFGAVGKKFARMSVSNLYVDYIEGNKDTFSVSISSNIFREGALSLDPKNSFESGDKILVVDENNSPYKISYLDTLPNGIVIPWIDTANIPDGWVACEGGSAEINGVIIEIPDMRGMFIAGTKQDNNQVSNRGNTTIDSSQSIKYFEATWPAGTHNHSGYTEEHELTQSQTRHSHKYERIKVKNTDVGNEGSNLAGRVEAVYESSLNGNPDSEEKGKGHRHSISAAANHQHTYEGAIHTHELNVGDVGRYELVMIIKLGNNYS